MKDQAQIRPSFIGSFTWPSMPSPTMCRSQARLWLSASVLFPFSELLFLSSVFLTSKFFPPEVGGSRGSPARRGLRAAFVGSKPWSLNVSPGMEQHRGCIWQQQQVLHWEKGRGGLGEAWGSLVSVCARHKFFTITPRACHDLPVNAALSSWF